jgi:hypothetical protein
MVLREFQDGGRIKLESRAKRWYIKGRLPIDTTFDPLKSRWTVPLKILSLTKQKTIICERTDKEKNTKVKPKGGRERKLKVPYT